jgi:hypothetical protein
MERVRSPKKPRDSSGPRTYKVLANIKLAIFRENCSEDELTEDDDQILEELGREFHGTPKGELPHLWPFRLEESALINILVNGSLGPLTNIGWY